MSNLLTRSFEKGKVWARRRTRPTISQNSDGSRIRRSGAIRIWCDVGTGAPTRQRYV